MKLKRLIVFITCLYLCLIIVSPIFGQTLITTAVRYNTCYDNSSSKTTGQEITIPVGIAYKGEYFSFSVESAYSSADVNTGDETDSKLASFTDTLLSVSYTHPFHARPIALILAVDINLPTGQERLNATQEIAELGENNDLFEVDNFGEGLNVSLSLGLMEQFEDTVLAVQGAYIFTGGFDPTSDVSDDDLDPGDQLLVLGLFDWQVSSWLKFGTILSYSYYWADKTNGEKDFQQGNQVSITEDISVIRAPVEFSLRLYASFPKISKESVEGTLQLESGNSSGTNISMAAALTYNFSSKFAMQLQGDIRYYGETDLKDEQTDLPYSGERVRYALGPGFTYLLSKRLSCNGLLKFFTMDQNRDMFTEDDITFQGMNLELGLTYTF